MGNSVNYGVRVQGEAFPNARLGLAFILNFGSQRAQTIYRLQAQAFQTGGFRRQEYPWPTLHGQWARPPRYVPAPNAHLFNLHGQHPQQPVHGHRRGLSHLLGTITFPSEPLGYCLP